MKTKYIAIAFIFLIGLIPFRINEITPQTEICGRVRDSFFSYPCIGPWPMDDCWLYTTWWLWEPPESWKGHIVKIVNPIWGERCMDENCGCDRYIVDCEAVYFLDSCDECEGGPCGKDSDNDGVNDCEDDCYNPGCSIVDSRGCPRDSDGDGISDCDDDCPYEQGPASNDGCPERDSDGDGVPDDRDDCYNPGCSIVDSRGCPRDSDGDGISDCDDDCPHEKENYNGYQDNDGCPDTPPTTPPPTTPPPEIPEEIKYKLASEYAPTLWLTKAEEFGPILAEFFIMNSEVWKEENLKLRMNGPIGSIQLQEEYDEWNMKIDNPVYFHVGTERYNGKDYIYIQYWFHYLYNHGILTELNHEGEWEMIMVILEDDNSIRNGTSFPVPYMAAYSSHYSGKAHKWTNEIMKKTLRLHPVVYVAEGTHASYFTYDNKDHPWDVTEEGSRVNYNDLHLINIEVNVWLKGIKGKWGIDIGSPKGPYYQDEKWDNPVKWAMSLLNSTELYLGSPARMLIKDKNGRRIGYLGDKFISEIPDAYAIISDEHEYYHLPLGDYSVVITAFDEGKIDFDIIINDNGEATYISYRDKSVANSTKAYSDLTKSKKYELRIDEDGDGSIDEIIAPDEITEFKDKKELSSYLPYILFSLAIVFVAVMIYRARTGGIERQAKLEEELSRKLQTKVMNGTLTQEEYEQKLEDIGLGRKAVLAEESGGILTNHTSELARKLDEKIEKEEIGREEYFQLMENLGLIPTNEVKKKLLDRYRSGEIDKKEYLRKKKDLEEA